LFAFAFIGSAAVVFFASAPELRDWYARYAAESAARAERDRLDAMVIAAKKEKDEQEKKERESKFQIGLAAAIRLRESMKNSDSFRLEKTLRSDNGAFCYWYRATNSFNAIVPGQAVLTSEGFYATGHDQFLLHWLNQCEGVKYDHSKYEDFDTIPYALNNLIKR
jgi:hypothetical protein